MPATYTLVFDRQRRRGTLAFHGYVRLAELLEGGLALLHHPDWEDGFDEIWDLRHIETVYLPLRDIQGLLQVEDLTEGMIQRTAIVASSMWYRLLGRLYARLLAKRRPIKVFDTLEAARAWLDTPPAKGV